MNFAKCRHGISLADAVPCWQCAVATQNVDYCFKEKQVNDPSSPLTQCCDHGVPLIYECAKCYRETENITTKKTVEVVDVVSRPMTPHEFSCAILDKLNANNKVHTVEIRTLCLMIQEQATQLRAIREATNQGVRSGRVVV